MNLIEMDAWDGQGLKDIARDMVAKAIFALEDLYTLDKEKYLQFAPQVLEMIANYYQKII